MKHSLKEWIAVTRYWSFPVSSMPVVATTAYLCSRSMVCPEAIPLAILALLGVVILHSAGNVLSDWFDYRTGVDNPDAFAVPNLVFGKFQPKEYLVFSIVLFALGCLIGLLLTALTGWKLLVIGGTGVLLTVAYSFLKYNALGDLDIFVIFSVLIIMGTSHVITGAVVPEALVLALPLGTITVSVLHANNTFDIESDGRAGMKSFAMLLGGRRSAGLYRIYMAVPFVCVVAAVIGGLLSPFALLCLGALVPAAKNFKAASNFEQKGIRTMEGLDQASAKLQLIFSGLLSAGLFIAALLQ